MKPTADQVAAGVRALHDITQLRSVKRDPHAAVEAVYEAMTAEDVLPPPALVLDDAPALDSLGGTVAPPIAPRKRRRA